MRAEMDALEKKKRDEEARASAQEELIRKLRAENEALVKGVYMVFLVCMKYELRPLVKGTTANNPTPTIAGSPGAPGDSGVTQPSTSFAVQVGYFSLTYGFFLNFQSE